MRVVNGAKAYILPLGLEDGADTRCGRKVWGQCVKRLKFGA